MTREQQTRLQALEQRESRYEKIGQIGAAFRCDAEKRPGPDDLFLFKATPENERWGCEQHPILQSYLDCVLAGFQQTWGAEGIDHFLETTDGWHVPVLKDRSAPLYPRAVKIDPNVLDLIDAKLAALNLTYLED